MGPSMELFEIVALFNHLIHYIITIIPFHWMHAHHIQLYISNFNYFIILLRNRLHRKFQNKIDYNNMALKCMGTESMQGDR